MNLPLLKEKKYFVETTLFQIYHLPFLESLNLYCISVIATRSLGVYYQNTFFKLENVYFRIRQKKKKLELERHFQV